MTTGMTWNLKEKIVTLIKDLGMKYATDNSKSKKRFGLYECPHCCVKFEAMVTNVKGGKTTKCRGCGDINSGDKRRVHGENMTNPLYSKWVHMRQRIKNPNDKDYKHYGGRGITICNEWDEFIPFRDWCLSNGYKKNLTIHRVNNDGNYEPSNCIFTNQTVQTRVSTKIRKTNKSGYRGVSKNKKAWCATISVNYKRIHIGSFKDKKDAAMAYDEYITNNNLEHTRNFNNE